MPYKLNPFTGELDYYESGAAYNFDVDDFIVDHNDVELNTVRVEKGGTGLTEIPANSVLYTDIDGKLLTKTLNSNELLLGTDQGIQALSLSHDENISISISGNSLQIGNSGAYSWQTLSESGEYDLTNRQAVRLVPKSGDTTTGNLIFTLSFDAASEGTYSSRIVGCGDKMFQINVRPGQVMSMGDSPITTSCTSADWFCSLEAIYVKSNPDTWVLIPELGNFTIN